MKKKVLALVCAMSLVCSGSLTANAAGSVTAEKVTEIANAVDNAVGEAAAELPTSDATVKADPSTGSINVTVSQEADKGGNVEINIAVDEDTRIRSAEAAQKAVVEVEGAAQNVTVKALDAEAITTPLAKIAVEVAKQVVNSVKNLASDKKIAKVETAFVADISADSEGAVGFNVETLNNNNAGGVKIDVAAVSAGSQRVYAMHYTSSGAVERINCQIVNNVLTFKMSGFSPVAIIVETVEDVQPVGEDAGDEEEEEENSAAGTANNSSAAVSPKTAEAGATAAVVVIAMMSIAGLVVLKRRVHDII